MPRHYTNFAASRGIELAGEGLCQFCGAELERGVHECVEIFELGFGGLGLSAVEDHRYRFFLVDAHALQHPELHGRWSNHFHLARLRLIFEHGVAWTYADSPRLSAVLDVYKAGVPDQVLTPPAAGERGAITSAHVRAYEADAVECRAWIERWAESVHEAWSGEHATLDELVERARAALGR